MGIANFRNFTPAKTVITQNVVQVGDKVKISAAVSFKNKAGRKIEKEQCKHCFHCGRVQVDLYGFISRSCDKDIKSKGWYLLYGKGKKPCKYSTDKLQD
jgi:hypothetical protein